MIRKRDHPTLEALYRKYGRSPWSSVDAAESGIEIQQGALAAMRNRGLIGVMGPDGTVTKRTHHYTVNGVRPPNRWVITDIAVKKLCVEVSE